MKIIKPPTEIKTPDGASVYDVQEIKTFLRLSFGDGKVAEWDSYFSGKGGIIFDLKYCVFDHDWKRFLNNQGIMIGGTNGK